MPLRIFNGDTAIGGFREAFGREESTDVLVCRDVLICGPLPEFTSMEEWRPGREAFWREVLGDANDSEVVGSDFLDCEISFRKACESESIEQEMPIRRYVLAPAQSCKDLRTGVAQYDLKKIWNGKIDPFLLAFIETPVSESA